MEDKTRDNQFAEDMITMIMDSDGFVDFYVLEETRVNAVNYLLVTDVSEDQDGEYYTLKDVSGQEDTDAVYEFVEDGRGPDGLMSMPEELLSDADVELEEQRLEGST